ncbi:spore germination protein [Bacillus salitolerans]|uniref:Spore germination protein n=1 Tax=Bacillus salitolerans TaxID=1437434 RepID=A0ABW4LV99_9BACI
MKQLWNNLVKQGNQPTITNEANKTAESIQVEKELDVNLEEIKKAFSYPKNSDLVIRNIFIKSLKLKAIIIFLDHTTNTKIIEEKVMIPLLEGSLNEYELAKDTSTVIMNDLISAKEATKLTDINQVINELLIGNTMLLLDNQAYVISIQTTEFEARKVEKPNDENILKGPKEAFVESVSTNISLIRKALKSQDLVSEKVTLGARGISTVTMLYMSEIANDQLIEKVRKRIEDITAEDIQTLGILEQHIEDRPYSIVPTVLYTERPDRAVAFLKEGHIVLLMDTSPSALVVPVTFWAFFHTSEDTYARWLYGNFSRIIRLLAMFVTLFVPCAYIAITNYHVEMLPTDLVLAISASRERVPFPAIFEVILLLIAFELIREGGVRVPTPIGPTIGIVGALILGQAAVEANIISPILVIVVAVTGLASFAVPNLSLNYFVRLSTYIFLLFGALWGFLGIAVCLTIGIAYLTSIKSFDVPILSPLAPHYPSSKDLVVRPPVWKQWLRPFHVHPKDPVRAEKPGKDESE